jgi:hypothetical protein
MDAKPLIILCFLALRAVFPRSNGDSGNCFCNKKTRCSTYTVINNEIWAGREPAKQIN